MKPIKTALFIVLTILYSCGDDQVNNPTGSTEAPLQVKVTEVKNISGASIITRPRLFTQIRCW